MLGGLWNPFRARLGNVLVDAGIEVKGPRPGLEGVNPANICNRGQSGAGGQMEVSEGLRPSLRDDPTRLRWFADLVRSVLVSVEKEMMGER